MRFIALLLLLGACQKPQEIDRRAPEAGGTEQPAAPGEPTFVDKRFQLTWTKAPQAVTHYEVLFGLTATSIAEKIMTVTTSQGFDSEKPAAIVTIAGARLAGQKQACFQIVAANATGTSAPSDPRCLPLP